MTVRAPVIMTSTMTMTRTVTMTVTMLRFVIMTMTMTVSMSVIITMTVTEPVIMPMPVFMIVTGLQWSIWVVRMFDDGVEGLIADLSTTVCFVQRASHFLRFLFHMSFFRRTHHGGLRVDRLAVRRFRSRS